MLLDYCKEQGFVDLNIYRLEKGQPIGKGLGRGTDGDIGTGISTPKRTSSTRKYRCQCGVSVRASKEVFIICGRCMSVMDEAL
jgi:hypothetical protein